MDWYRSKVFTWRKSAASVVEAMTLSKAPFDEAPFDYTPFEFPQGLRQGLRQGRQGARLKAQGFYPNAVPVSF
jgi:hypothetical protein